MSLHADLLEQATHLARRERRRPRQASLRRAVSAAYYAAFHLLAHDGARLLASGSGVDGIRAALRRGFDHAEMAAACRSVYASQLPPGLANYVGGIAIPPELRKVARTFLFLQQKRHDADYNVAVRYSRADVLDIVDETQVFFANWSTVRSDPSARLFLVALFSYRKLRP